MSLGVVENGLKLLESFDVSLLTDRQVASLISSTGRACFDVLPQDRLELTNKLLSIIQKKGGIRFLSLFVLVLAAYPLHLQ